MRYSHLTEASTWFMIVTKDGFYRVFDENDPEYLAALKDGWDLAFDSAKSRSQADEWADARGLKPWDRHAPKMMREPKVLYRSVSPPELLDILKTGKVLGRQNRFNDFDPRRWVFFGDEVNDHLIYQGEEIERQAVTTLGSHSIHSKFADIQSQLEEIREARLALAKDYIERKRVNLLPQDIKAMDNGIVPSFLSVRLDSSPRYKALTAKHTALTKKQKELQNRYRDLVKAAYSKLKDKSEGSRFTSAVLTTKPLSGAVHYSKTHGSSGMGDNDEYGFPSGFVTIDDITHIQVLRKGEVVAEGTPDDIKKWLKQRTG